LLCTDGLTDERDEDNIAELVTFDKLACGLLNAALQKTATETMSLWL
jgi:serine/threonine protein phosphatase PrpC